MVFFDREGGCLEITEGARGVHLLSDPLIVMTHAHAKQLTLAILQHSEGEDSEWEISDDEAGAWEAEVRDEVDRGLYSKLP